MANTNANATAYKETQHYTTTVQNQFVGTTLLRGKRKSIKGVLALVVTSAPVHHVYICIVVITHAHVPQDTHPVSANAALRRRPSPEVLVSDTPSRSVCSI